MPPIVGGAAEHVVQRRPGRLGLERFEFALEALLALEHLAQLVDHVVGPGREQAADVGQRAFALRDLGQRAGAGHRLDAAHAGGHARLRHDA